MLIVFSEHDSYINDNKKKSLRNHDYRVIKSRFTLAGSYIKKGLRFDPQSEQTATKLANPRQKNILIFLAVDWLYI